MSTEFKGTREPGRQAEIVGYPAPRVGGSGGFTLIEVVLALTIFALLAGIVYASFSLSHRAMTKAQTSAERNQAERATLELLGNYIRSAYPYRSNPQDQSVFFDGGRDQLTFVSAYSHALGGRGMAIVRISSERSDDGGAAVSLEEITPVRLDRDENTGGRSERLVIREHVADFRLDYLDPQSEEETWEELWDGQERRRLPRAVRLTYRDGSDREVRRILPVMMVVLAP